MFWKKLRMRLSVRLLGEEFSIIPSSRLKRLLEIKDMSPAEFAMYKAQEHMSNELNKAVFGAVVESSPVLSSLRDRLNRKD